MTNDFSKNLYQFMGGIKFTLSKESQDSRLNFQEGKVSIFFQVYNFLFDFLIFGSQM